MNYRHAFHAGNFADVFKHTILIGLLQALKEKPAPFCYLDTHAGAACYDLRGAEAAKTQEAHAGVARLLGRVLSRLIEIDPVEPGLPRQAQPIRHR